MADDAASAAAIRPAGTRVAALAVSLALTAGAAVVTLWFLHEVVVALLLLFFAMVVAIALSAPVAWFTRRGLSRHLAAVLTLLLFFASVVLLGWLVIPRLVGQVVLLVNDLPALVAGIRAQLAALLADHPDLQAFVSVDGNGAAPDLVNLFRGVGAFSLSLIGGLALTIIFFSTVAYIILDPRPILRGYIASLPYT
ncbi:MAG: AI-2E family transporter, partial [Pseudomonadota bacterium]|nr:AI-2E family transporter [Pseudomonadota bacterium]